MKLYAPGSWLLAALACCMVTTQAQELAKPVLLPPGAQPQAPAGDGARQWEREHRASRLIGTEIRTREGRKVGELRDLIVDQSGNITLGVISSGGFLGIGDRLHAVPWETLKPGDRGERILDADPAALEQAPVFGDRTLPNLSDERWVNENRRVFGY